MLAPGQRQVAALEDDPQYFLQVSAGPGAVVRSQRFRGLRVSVQRLAAAPTPVQGEHELRPRPLRTRISHHPPAHVGDNPLMVAEIEQEVGEVVFCQPPQFQEAGRFGGDLGRIGHVNQGRIPPEG